MSTSTRRNGRATVKHAHKTVHALQDDALDLGHHLVENVREQATHLSDLGRERLDDLRDAAISAIKKHPLRALAGAVAVGCVASFLLRRR